MAQAFNYIQQFVEDLANGAHDLANDTLKLALCSAAPVATNEVLADLTEVAYTNVSGDRVLANQSSAHVTGTLTLDADDEVITASGGAIPTFRYVALYNDTQTSPADPLIGWWDYGSNLDLADGESLTVQFNASGILTIANA